MNTDTIVFLNLVSHTLNACLVIMDSHPEDAIRIIGNVAQECSDEAQRIRENDHA
jgi:hypothetical protein